ncbi:hypothetical protein HK096_003276 [Nowakowskiella sp. JEL0078]|nr:hypothetical protein HK096_003276 [Nowakowskiella sp. JEL0078]
MNDVLIQKYERDENWIRLLEHHETKLEFSTYSIGEEKRDSEVLRALGHLKLHRITDLYAAEMLKVGSKSIGVKLNTLKTKDMLFERFNKYLYNAIKSFIENDTTSSFDFVRRGMLPYSHIEPLLSLRTSILRAFDDLTRISQVEDHMIISELDNHLLKVCKLARKSGNHKDAYVAFETLRALHKEQIPILGIVSQLKTVWSQGDQSTAIRTLKWVLENRVNGESDGVRGKLLMLLGRWIGESRIESPNSVIETYFEKAVELTKLEPEKIGSGYIHLARFADALFQDMENNDLNKTLNDLMLLKSHEVQHLKTIQSQSSTTPEMKSGLENQIKKLQMQIDIDKSEYSRFNSDKSKFLLQSVENYLKALAYSDKSNMCIFRLCTLWFANQTNEEINFLIDNYSSKIPSYKFLTLVYQLSARMSAIIQNKSEPKFQITLARLIFKMALDHPHHTLPQILALQNGDVGTMPVNEKVSARRQQQTKKSIHTLAATRMIQQLKQSSAEINETISQMEKLFNAYIEFAMWKPEFKDGRGPAKPGSYLFDNKKFTLANIGELDKVPITTVEIPVRQDLNYKFAHFCGFGKNYQLIGGINLPKIVECLDSTGVNHKQLVKGSDDLRQDAVLLKIFSLVNELLKSSSETRKRKLNIRTYRVVPLSPRAGVLEWVENTTTLGNYLTEAHVRYNKNDFSPAECRRRMNIEHGTETSTIDSKLRTFQKICQNFKPVFRNFFFEKFLDPKEWFEKRQNYVKSIASSSMTGFVVGLGDRHAQNILVDMMSAEIVNIDFGICFDSGRLLSTPEIVPFRLTRDIVDGMGITGVEGVFRKSCEEMLKLLRSESAILLAVLDVFRYDPLYVWYFLQI